MEINVGSKIRELRKEKKLSIASLAKSADLSTGLISQIERNLVVPSSIALWRIAKSLGVSIGYFFNESEVPSVPPVVKANQRKKITTDSSKALYELLTPDLNRKIEFLQITLTRGDASSENLIAHAGEECGIVLKGSLLVKFEDVEYLLNEGDSISFESTKPHKYVNVGDTESVSIWAMTPPSW